MVVIHTPKDYRRKVDAKVFSETNKLHLLRSPGRVEGVMACAGVDRIDDGIYRVGKV